MPERTYVGPLPRGAVKLPDRRLRFERGVAVEVTADEAALLGSEWSAAKKKADKPEPEPEQAKSADTKKEPTP